MASANLRTDIPYLARRKMHWDLANARVDIHGSLNVSAHPTVPFLLPTHRLICI